MFALLFVIAATDATHAPCEAPPAGMSCVAGGVALVGDDKRAMDIATFYIDVHEITHAQYAACVASRAPGACKPLDVPPINQRIMIPFMGDTQPAMPLDFARAQAFCAWAGKRLPTEWEWEKAARGPDGDVYPWGNDPPSCDKAQVRECAPKGCTPYRGKKYEWDCVEHATKPVGSYPAGHYGVFDMAGNGYEWTSSAPTSARGDKRRVLRGGSWYWPASQIKASHRRFDRPDTGHHRLSARCASTPSSTAATTEAPSAAPSPAPVVR